MENKEKLELINMLCSLNGLIITSKLEGTDIKDNIERAKKVAAKLMEEGIGKFDFSSDEKFEISLSDFLADID